MRNPSIHIKLDDFIVVLNKLGMANAKDIAYSIFSAAVPYNTISRSMVTGSKVVTDKAKKAIAASKAADMTVERFNLLLDNARRNAGHKHFKPIRRGTSAFLQLKEVAQQAVEFAHYCDIESVEEGCKIYIQLGLDKMKKSIQYNLVKFKYHDSGIYKAYESYDMIVNDPKPKRTKSFHDCYVMLLAEYAGISRQDLEADETYVCFVYARLEAAKVKADTEDWLRAQFEGLSRAFDAVPNPNQLFSDWATKRYYDYIKGTHNTEETKVTLDIETTKSDFERKYEEKMKAKYSEQ